MDTSLPRSRRLRSRRLEFSAQTFRRITLLNAVMLTAIVSTGATVRLTGSGLGCHHWPGCTAGDPLPSNGYHSYVEFSNRIVAAITILITLATWIAAILVVPRGSWVRRVAGFTFLGTLAQAPLGAITVYYKLNPLLVFSHFLLSLVVLTLGVIVALEAYGVRGEPVPKRIKQLAVVVAVACGALVVSGGFATAAGPHSGSSDVPRIGKLQPAVWVHVRATAVFGIAFALLAAWLLARRSRRHLWSAGALLGLLAVQMVIGEIQYRTKLPLGLVLVHVTLSALIWAAASVFIALFWRPRAPGRIS